MAAAVEEKRMLPDRKRELGSERPAGLPRRELTTFGRLILGGEGLPGGDDHHADFNGRSLCQGRRGPHDPADADRRPNLQSSFAPHRYAFPGHGN